MSHYILIPVGTGTIAHSNVEDPAVYNLPDTAEIYDDRQKFEGRLDELGVR